jgi:hypothetical protein
MNAIRIAALACAALLSGMSPDRAGARPFPVYDNMFFADKPATDAHGIVASNIIYGEHIWPQFRNYGVLPRREAYESVVAAHCGTTGPIVIDIERMPFAGDRRTAEQRLHVFATLADWTHAAAPGRVVGYFGYNVLTDVRPEYRDLARELVRHVDAFFPAMYANNDDRAAWARRADALIRQYRAYDPDKPIYFYLWPQYNAHTPKAYQWIAHDYWKFQLETAHRVADGIVLWGTKHAAWNTSSGWWTATVDFMRRLRGVDKPRGLVEVDAQR